MTPDEVRTRVARLDSLKVDPEDAHDAEDGIYKDVLRFIAVANNPDAKALAAEAIKAADVDFPRWYA